MCVECVPCIVEYDERNVERGHSDQFMEVQQGTGPEKTSAPQLLPLQMTKAGSCTILSIKRLQVYCDCKGNTKHNYCWTAGH